MEKKNFKLNYQTPNEFDMSSESYCENLLVLWVKAEKNHEE